MREAIKRFLSIPRVPLAPLDTPIERCERLQDVVPGLPDLYVKRDDYIGPLVWGNKLRKLEYALAEARAQGADTVVTCGGIQSNHARITAQVCRRMGLDCVLVLSGEKPAQPRANFLIDDRLGIPIHHVETRAERTLRVKEIAGELEAQGKNVFRIPLGASDDIGSFGFVRAMHELVQQQEALGVRLDYLVHGASSGGTQAGLLVGKALFEQDPLRVIGISADNSAEDIRRSVMSAAEPMLDRLGLNGRLTRGDLRVDDGYVGDGYALPTPASTRAEELFAVAEGILLDKVYTAKAAAAIIDYSRSGVFAPTDKVLFWHTGGLITLFE